MKRDALPVQTSALPELTPEEILHELERAERAGFLDGCRVGRLAHFLWGCFAGGLLVAAAFQFGVAP